jgi:hypothetical protein
MLEEEQLDLIIDVPHPDSLNYQNIFSPRNTSSWPFRKCT